MVGGVDEDPTAVGGRNAATSSFSGAISCVPNYCLYGQLYTELSGGMAPASPQAPPPYFDRRRIRNVIAVDKFGSPGLVKELYFQFGDEWLGWENIVQDLEEEVCRLRCKVKEGGGCHEYG